MAIPATPWQSNNPPGEFGTDGPDNIVDPSGTFLVDPSTVFIVDTGVSFNAIPATVWSSDDGI